MSLAYALVIVTGASFEIKEMPTLHFCQEVRSIVLSGRTLEDVAQEKDTAQKREDEAERAFHKDFPDEPATEEQIASGRTSYTKKIGDYAVYFYLEGRKLVADRKMTEVLNGYRIYDAQKNYVYSSPTDSFHTATHAECILNEKAPAK